MRSRRFALVRADLEDAVCPLPEDLAATVAGRESVTVVLEHRMLGVTPARESFESAAVHDPGPRLTGIAWPADVRPGVFVTVAWRPSEECVSVRTTALDEPLRVDGVDYFHDYDPTVITREFDPGLSNRGRVLKAVRRLGRVFDDGSAVFPEAELPAHCGLGRGKKGMFLLRNAVDQLLREGYVTRVTGSTGPDGQLDYPAVDGAETLDLLFYAPLVEEAPLPGEDGGDGHGDGGERRDHWVNGFVRRLPPGAHASKKQQTLHQKAIEKEQIDGFTLEPGYTFVKRHHRG
ncbi:hypothetical protein Aph02nite_81860 [Actinoplanes philippinensis]|uniref:Uncharacterized protein n=1 Tax=Actinoplanes philippinensis TaxID=35752 RepID=A0A1I2LWV0_9ACTN|nr:hypothetical protein [Actinoplanes philippinensis]GIE82236.1 hypothetical protein Aph02nite_81860 [Actinoplanes philippinensis]SFF82990.1 hypothetical protein SAMN05421541_12457 [Actinoplanes philippinensis]